MNTTTELSNAVMPGFNSVQSWELAQRIGKAFASSSLVPQTYQNNLSNCIVALEMANRMGASPLMVMQNLYIVHGNPGWSSKFLIACFNQSGRFSAMRYEFVGAEGTDERGCRAWAIEKATNEKLVGATITLRMAKDEGWSSKNGSKWKTMPEQMLMYRAAAFFVRTFAPEISMGLSTSDELVDMGPVVELYATPDPAVVVETTPSYSDEDFNKNTEKWRAAIESGKKTPEDIIAMASSKGTLSEAQKQEIQAMAKKPSEVIDATPQDASHNAQYDEDNPFNE